MSEDQAKIMGYGLTAPVLPIGGDKVAIAIRADVSEVQGGQTLRYPRIRKIRCMLKKREIRWGIDFAAPGSDITCNGMAYFDHEGVHLVQ